MGSNNNTGPRGEDIVKIYEDKHGDYTILAVFEDNYVRWSKREQRSKGEEGEEVSTIQEFQKMIQKEGWTELYYNNKKWNVKILPIIIEDVKEQQVK